MLAGLAARAVAQDSASIGAGTITTFAGVHGTPWASGVTDNQAPTKVPLGGVAIGGSFPNAVTVDASGNVYVAVGGGDLAYVGVVYAGGTVPPLLRNRTASPTPGFFYYIVGQVYTLSDGDQLGGACSPSTSANNPCGEGEPALQNASGVPVLFEPVALAVDEFGNLYISDPGLEAIREVKASNGKIYTIAGDLKHKSAGYNGDNIAAKGAYLNNPQGIALDSSGNLYIADSGNDLVRKVDAASGKISTVAGTPPPSGTTNYNPCTKDLLPCGDGGSATAALLKAPASVFVTGTGALYIADQGDNAIREVSGGAIKTVAGQLLTPCANAPCGDFTPATDAQLNNPSYAYLDPLGNLLISDQGDNSLRVVKADSGDIETVVGHTAPSVTGAFGGDGKYAFDAGLNQPTQFAFDRVNEDLYIADQQNDVVRQVTAGTPLAQTITFDSIPILTYGHARFHLNKASSGYASASSGLALTYSVTGPATISGDILTITGVGDIKVTASQGGNGKYDAAASVSQTITVNPATLIVTARNDSDSSVPSVATLCGTATGGFCYTITGFVSGETLAAVSGAPDLKVENSAGVVQLAGTTPPAGTYTIKVAQGTLNAANYTFRLVNGTLTITGSELQTIMFGALPDITYGAANSTFTLAAKATSGLPVNYTISPTSPAKIHYSAAAGWTVAVTGAGTVGITATQAGNNTYGSAAPVYQTFKVIPAVLTITANNLDVVYGTANPVFTYIATGFVLTDTIAVLSGTPAFSTTATSTSPKGPYPIVVSQGTLAAANYSFQFVPATLTITTATQTINFPSAPFNNMAYTYGANDSGNSVYVANFSVVASSGLPVTCTSTGPVTVDCSLRTATATGVGPASITVTQAGNADYSSASVTDTFTVAPGTVLLQATNAAMAQGADLPQFTYSFPTSVPPANLYSGIPTLATTATSASPAGTYPIVISQGTLTSPVYNFSFANGNLTITPPATYTLAVNPDSVTIPSGQSRQVTVSMTPINNYAGSVTIGCTGLPVGVTCTASPASLTTSLNSNGGTSSVQGTLTISNNQVVAAGGWLRPHQPDTLAASLLCFPAGISCMMLVFYRQRLKKSGLWLSIFLASTLLASMTGIAACGGGSQSSASTPPSSVQVTVTGTAPAAPGTANLNQSVTLTVNIH